MVLHRILSYFFDARTGNVNEFNFYFAPMINDSAAFGRNPAGNRYYGYCALSSQWTNYEVLDFTFGSDFKGFIGLVYSANKIYTYNGLQNSWTEFIPQGGEYKDYCIGTKTALMVRNQMIYAFDPQAITGIENTYPVAFKNFDLQQNFPNPFNPSTRIQYQVPSISQVVLKIYDILGNEIATLVNEEKPAGRYEVEFNTSNINPASTAGGHHPSSGVYFCRLSVVPKAQRDLVLKDGQTENYSKTIKMLLIK